MKKFLLGAMTLFAGCGISYAVDGVCLNDPNCMGDKVILINSTPSFFQIISTNGIVFGDGSSIGSANGLGGVAGAAAMNVKFGATFVAITSAIPSGDILFSNQSGTWVIRVDLSSGVGLTSTQTISGSKEFMSPTTFWHTVTINNTTVTFRLNAAANNFTATQYLLSKNFDISEATGGASGQGEYFSMSGDNIWGSHYNMTSLADGAVGVVVGMHGANQHGFVFTIDDSTATGTPIHIFQQNGTASPDQTLLRMDAGTRWENWIATRGIVPNGDFSSGHFIKLLNSGTTEFFVNSAGNTYVNGLLGIGTQNPTQELHIVASNIPAILMTDSDGPNTIQFYTDSGSGGYGLVGTQTSDPFIITSGNVERMRLGRNGAIGIGTANPLTKLHVSSAAGSGGSMMAVSTGATNIFEVNGTSVVFKVPIYDGMGNPFSTSTAGGGGGGGTNPETGFNAFVTTGQPFIDSWTLSQSTVASLLKSTGVALTQLTAAVSASTGSNYGVLQTTTANLATSGHVINQSSNPVHWNALQGVPAGFADGADATTAGGGDDLGNQTATGTVIAPFGIAASTIVLTGTTFGTITSTYPSLPFFVGNATFSLNQSSFSLPTGANTSNLENGFLAHASTSELINRGSSAFLTTGPVIIGNLVFSTQTMWNQIYNIVSTNVVANTLTGDDLNKAAAIEVGSGTFHGNLYTTGTVTFTGQDFIYKSTDTVELTHPAFVQVSTSLISVSTNAAFGQWTADGNLSTGSSSTGYYKWAIPNDVISNSTVAIVWIQSLSTGVATQQESWVISFATAGLNTGPQGLTYTKPVVLNITGTTTDATNGGVRDLSTLTILDLGVMMQPRATLYVRATRDGANTTNDPNLSSSILNVIELSFRRQK